MNEPAFRLINLSLGTEDFNPLVDEMLDLVARNDRVLLICASGNGGIDGKGDNNDLNAHYPSNYESDAIISVASINQKGILSDFSNFGKNSVISLLLAKILE